MLAQIWSSPDTNGLTEVILNDTRIDNEDLYHIFSSWAQNMSIEKFTVWSSLLQLSEKRNWDPVIEALKKNCSVTSVHIQASEALNEMFKKEMQEELDKNKMIREQIFPNIQKEQKHVKQQKTKTKKSIKGKKMKGLVTSSVTLENKKKVRSLSVTNQNTKEKLYCGYNSSDDLFRSVIKKPDCMVCDSDSFSSSDAEEDNNLQNLY